MPFFPFARSPCPDCYVMQRKARHGIGNEYCHHAVEKLVKAVGCKRNEREGEDQHQFGCRLDKCRVEKLPGAAVAPDLRRAAVNVDSGADYEWSDKEVGCEEEEELAQVRAEEMAPVEFCRMF